MIKNRMMKHQNGINMILIPMMMRYTEMLYKNRNEATFEQTVKKTKLTNRRDRMNRVTCTEHEDYTIVLFR